MVLSCRAKRLLSAIQSICPTGLSLSPSPNLHFLSGRPIFHRPANSAVSSPLQNGEGPGVRFHSRADQGARCRLSNFLSNCPTGFSLNPSPNLHFLSGRPIFHRPANSAVSSPLQNGEGSGVRFLSRADQGARCRLSNFLSNCPTGFSLNPSPNLCFLSGRPIFHRPANSAVTSPLQNGEGLGVRFLCDAFSLPAQVRYWLFPSAGVILHIAFTPVG